MKKVSLLKISMLQSSSTGHSAGIRKIFFLASGLLVLLLFFFSGQPVSAAATEEETDKKIEEEMEEERLLLQNDCEEIQKVLDEQGTEVDFSGLVSSLMEDGAFFSKEHLAETAAALFSGELKDRKELLLFLMGLTIITGVLVNYSDLFQNGRTSEIAYYVCYLMLFTSLAGTYYMEMDLAREAFTHLISFMRVLMPSYFISLTFQGAVGSSVLFYESSLFLISLVERITLYLLIPLSNCYFLILLSDYVGKRERFTKLAELIAVVIRWTLNTMLATVAGFHVIEGLILPYKDRLERSVLLNGMEAAPFVGSSVQGITRTLTGSGLVIKNAIGAAGLIVLVCICAVPVLRLFFHCFLYKFVAAVTQPVADKRFGKALHAAAEAVSLLGRMVFVGAVLFFLTIAIVSGTTSMGAL